MVKCVSALTLAVALMGATAFAQNSSTGKGSVADFQKSFQIATQSPPTATLLSSRVETKSDGTQVYGFYFYDPKSKQMFEREVSMTSGKIVKDTYTDTPVVKDPKKDPKDDKDQVSKDMLALLEKKITGKAKLPEGRLMEIAAAKLKDATFEQMKLEKVGDTLVMTFGDLQLDAETGKEIPKK